MIAFGYCRSMLDMITEKVVVFAFVFVAAAVSSFWSE
jgi:hypothetical protein